MNRKNNLTVSKDPIEILKRFDILYILIKIWFLINFDWDKMVIECIPNNCVCNVCKHPVEDGGDNSEGSHHDRSRVTIVSRLQTNSLG